MIWLAMMHQNIAEQCAEFFATTRTVGSNYNEAHAGSSIFSSDGIWKNAFERLFLSFDGNALMRLRPTEKHIGGAGRACQGARMMPDIL